MQSQSELIEGELKPQQGWVFFCHLAAQPLLGDEAVTLFTNDQIEVAPVAHWITEGGKCLGLAPLTQGQVLGQGKQKQRINLGT